MHHLYLSYQPSEDSLRKEREALEGWCREEGVKDYEILEENLTSGRISQRQLTKLLSPVREGDTVVATSLSRLGRGINMLLSVLKILHGKGAGIITIDDGRIFRPDDETASFIADMEAFTRLNVKIKAERSSEALDRAKADGKRFGRPVGRKKAPEKNVLYGKTELLEKLIADGVSKSEIARRLDVSRGTIVNYLSGTCKCNS